jgi:deazaflavin-dependent oxidoreductase (nitroreductase family)
MTPKADADPSSDIGDDSAAEAGWPDRAMTDELVAWGRIIELETTGRQSGRPRRAAVGYVDRADGARAIAATDPDTHWALNLLAEPRCRVRDQHGWRECRATPLHDAEHDATVAGLVLRYGTPAERLGRGPSFRLELADTTREADTA